MAETTATREREDEGLALSFLIPLREAVDTAPNGAVRALGVDKAARTARCILITEGLGNLRDRNYYTKLAIQTAVEAFEGRQFYVDHPTQSEDTERPERSVRDLAGYFFGCSEGQVQDAETGDPLAACFATLKFSESDAGNLAMSQVATALEYQKQFPRTKDTYAGISINASGMGEPGEIDGMQVNFVQEIQHAFSADIVTKPARGGRFLQLMKESEALSAWKRSRGVATAKEAEWDESKHPRGEGGKFGSGGGGGDKSGGGEKKNISKAEYTAKLEKVFQAQMTYALKNALAGEPSFVEDLTDEDAEEAARDIVNRMLAKKGINVRREQAKSGKTPESWEQMSPRQQEKVIDAWRPDALKRERVAQQEYDKEHPDEAEDLTDEERDEAEHESISWEWEGMPDSEKFDLAKKYGVLKKKAGSSKKSKPRREADVAIEHETKTTEAAEHETTEHEMKTAEGEGAAREAFPPVADEKKAPPAEEKPAEKAAPAEKAPADEEAPVADEEAPVAEEPGELPFGDRLKPLGEKLKAFAKGMDRMGGMHPQELIDDIKADLAALVAFIDKGAIAVDPAAAVPGADAAGEMPVEVPQPGAENLGMGANAPILATEQDAALEHDMAENEEAPPGGRAMRFSCAHCGEANDVEPPRGYDFVKTTEAEAEAQPDTEGIALRETIERLEASLSSKQRALDSKEGRFVEANDKLKTVMEENEKLREAHAKAATKLEAYERRDKVVKLLREAQIPPDVLAMENLLPFEPHQWGAMIEQAKRTVAREKKMLEGGAGEHVPMGAGFSGGDSSAAAVETFTKHYDGR